MKNINLLLCLVLLTFSCNDWLDIDPRTQKETSELFLAQKGFEDALTGTYLNLMNDYAYGESLTMTKIEFLANLWTPSGGLDITQGGLTEEGALCLHQFDHGSVKETISNIYEQLYKAILGASSILEYVDNDLSIFEEGAYEMIKGEALAIRAMCHFDILRLWGPVPGTQTEEPILNYVKTVSKIPHGISTYEEFKAQLFQDLNMADSLLAIGFEKYTDGAFEKNIYLRHYPFRFNVFAAKGLLARAHLWFGEDQLANEYASYVIQASKKQEIPAAADGSIATVRLGNRFEFELSKEYNLPVEHLLCLYHFDLEVKFKKLFGGESAVAATSPLLYRDKISIIVARDIFDNITSDRRYAYLWEQWYASSERYFTLRKKYECDPKIDPYDRRYIPLIRLSEMYFIAIETGEDMTEKQNLWKEFRESRDVNAYPLPQSKEALQKLLLAEYRREFYGEGHTFYQYKRLNVSLDDFLWAVSDMNIQYVLPAPETENFYKPQ